MSTLTCARRRAVRGFHGAMRRPAGPPEGWLDFGLSHGPWDEDDVPGGVSGRALRAHWQRLGKPPTCLDGWRWRPTDFAFRRFLRRCSLERALTAVGRAREEADEKDGRGASPADPPRRPERGDA
jgi:hypothetical protein